MTNTPVNIGISVITYFVVDVGGLLVMTSKKTEFLPGDWIQSPVKVGQVLYIVRCSQSKCVIDPCAVASATIHNGQIRVDLPKLSDGTVPRKWIYYTYLHTSVDNAKKSIMRFLDLVTTHPAISLDDCGEWSNFDSRPTEGKPVVVRRKRSSDYYPANINPSGFCVALCEGKARYKSGEIVPVIFPQTFDKIQGTCQDDTPSPNEVYPAELLTRGLFEELSFYYSEYLRYSEDKEDFPGDLETQKNYTTVETWFKSLIDLIGQLDTVKPTLTLPATIPEVIPEVTGEVVGTPVKPPTKKRVVKTMTRLHALAWIADNISTSKRDAISLGGKIGKVLSTEILSGKVPPEVIDALK